jgi:serine protease inhibitor
MLMASCLCASACDWLPGGEDPQDPMPPAVPIELTKADAGIRDASNAAGLDIFRRLYAMRKGQDVSFSPLSLSLAFAMVAEGAEGATYTQIAEALGWGAVTREELGAFYKKMIEGLVKADPQVSFTSSNSFWAAADLVLNDPYRKLLSECFGAESYAVDFTAAATLSRINKWCSDKTDGKIPQMLQDLDPDTRLMLINALLYKAPWAKEWTVENGRVFKTENGTAVKKDYLYANREYPYAELPDCQAISLPYGNGAYEMVVFLPKDGKTVADILPTVAEHGGNLVLSPNPAEVYLPKFSTEYSTEGALIPILKEKGMTLPFSNGADFSGISVGEALKISQVLQKVKIDVTEKGTEFAAVTVIGLMKATAVGNPLKPVVFDADHPFVYLIRETSTDTVLLVGSLTK